MGGVVDFVSTTRALCSRAPPCGGVPPVKCLFKPCSGLKLFLAFWNGCPVRLNPTNPVWENILFKHLKLLVLFCRFNNPFREIYIPFERFFTLRK